MRMSAVFDFTIDRHLISIEWRVECELVRDNGERYSAGLPPYRPSLIGP